MDTTIAGGNSLDDSDETIHMTKYFRISEFVPKILQNSSLQLYLLDVLTHDLSTHFWNQAIYHLH